MILDVARLLFFPALMAFAAASDLFTMTISNRVSLALAAGFLALAFASGMASTTTVMHLVDPGDTVVSVNDVYGGTYRLFSKVYEPKGVRFRYLSADDFAGDVAAMHDDGARLR